MQPKAKQALHQIWLAETREDAEQAFDVFLETYEAKYPKATTCLAKDRVTLLAFYDFPAEHWAHLRTTNPIESTFATVRLRTAKTRGCLSRQTMLTMVFKLCRSAETRWRRLRGYQLLADRRRSPTRQDRRLSPYTTLDHNSAATGHYGPLCFNSKSFASARKGVLKWPRTET